MRSLKPVIALIVCGAICFVLMSAPTHTLQSQPPLQPIYADPGLGFFTPLQWSSDSAQLIFQASILADTPQEMQQGWHIYTVETQQLSPVPRNPTLPILTATQGELLGVADYEYLNGSVSPNGRYLVYSAPKTAGQWRDGRPLIGLTDLISGETMIINLPLALWNIKWSKSNNAFIIETDSYYACCFLFYFSDFAVSVKEVQSVIVSDVLSVDGRLGAAALAYDLSADGQKLLIGTFTSLAVWDITHPPEVTSFGSRDVIANGAIFSDDGRTVLYVTKTGLYRYDLETQQTSTVSLQAGTDLLAEAPKAAIAPNGKYLAIIYSPIGSSGGKIYILEVAQP